MARSSLTPQYEQPWWQRGKYVAGVDEVGRGALAGPVVAAAIVLPIGFVSALPVCDSKLLSPQQRQRVAAYLEQCAVAYAFGWVEPQVVDTLGIFQATLLAMGQALYGLRVVPDYVFVDGPVFPDVELPGCAIVDGDRRCLSIAAASIVAKVARDRWMVEVADLRYPVYGFAQHKGYGTPAHWTALRRYGPCSLHRRTFLRRLDTVADHERAL
ncbi:MAG: ribonuclease HII [Candidatus Kapabacteria bacterium]|nr:ribonuclease HII [Candidatus Kapabacteria bacterium]MDW8012372.1 ribonuclease HII [Bacteroidota bacterium]